ncbi:efflux RND transporter periplasmic adaptor subunit [Patescibacteria group bacterium]
MKINKWYFIVPVVIIAVILLVIIFGKKGVPVKEIPIKERVVKRTVSASGVVKSRDEADMSFASIGSIYNIAVKKGDEVKKGQYLAALDNYSESQAAQALKDTRDVAQRDLELFIEQYGSNMSAVSGEDEYEIKKRQYEELVSKAEATYQAQLGALGKTYLYASFDGRIIDIYKDVGETAMAGTSVIKIANEDKKVFEIELEQEDFEYLQMEQEVEITLDSYDDDIFTGKVLELPTYVNADNGGDFIIDIDLTGDTKSKALLGMDGDAFIILSKTDKKVKALTFDEIKYDIEDLPYVYVIKNDKVKSHYIELGLEGDIYTEIKTDITDPIIQESDSKYELEEGLKVKLIK